MTYAKLVLAFLVIAAFPQISTGQLRGTWMSRMKEDGREIQLTLRYRDNWNSSFGILMKEFKGLNTTNLKEGKVDQEFTMEREAGVVSFTGRFIDGEGSGHFTFRQNEHYAGELKSLGFPEPDA